MKKVCKGIYSVGDLIAENEQLNKGLYRISMDTKPVRVSLKYFSEETVNENVDTVFALYLGEQEPIGNISIFSENCLLEADQNFMIEKVINQEK